MTLHPHGHDRGRNPAASGDRTMRSNPGAIPAVGARGQSADGLAVCDAAALVAGAQAESITASKRVIAMKSNIFLVNIFFLLIYYERIEGYTTLM